MIDWRIMIKGWVLSLTLTLILELGYAWLWSIRDKHDLKLTVLVNVLTNPIVVFVCYFVRFRHLPVHYGWVTLVMEVLAVITEALLYKAYAKSIARPWLFSLSANSFSFAMGELLNGL